LALRIHRRLNQRNKGECGAFGIADSRVKAWPVKAKSGGKKGGGEMGGEQERESMKDRARI
jgi:hypothetical protein